VFVAEGVEDEAVFGYEGIAVSGKPISHCRFDAPR
jgi:hypothetical protein